MAGVLVCNLEYGIADVLDTDAGLVWVEVVEVQVYSCYFSPNDPSEAFKTQILLLEGSLCQARVRTLITGDFNSKSPEWGEARLHRKGIVIGEMVARNELAVLNWCELEMTTLSDRQCIEFSILERSEPCEHRKGWQNTEPSLEHKMTQQIQAPRILQANQAHRWA